MKKKSIVITTITIIIVVIAFIVSLIFIFTGGNTKAYNNKLINAQNYIAKMNYEKAEESYLKAIDVDPKKTEAYVELADVYVNMGEKDKAVSILKKAYKNVESNKNKAVIKDKQEEIQGDKVINNGTDYVTYKDKSYYWKYTSDSFKESLQFYDEDEDYDDEDDNLYRNIYSDGLIYNKLVSVDKKGNKKTIYESYGYGKIWIFGDNIYFCINEYEGIYNSITLDGKNNKTFEGVEILGVCKAGLLLKSDDHSLKVIKEDGTIKYIEKNSKKNNNYSYLNIVSSDYNYVLYTIRGNDSKKIFATTLKYLNCNNNKVTTLIKIDNEKCYKKSIGDYTGKNLITFIDNAQVFGNDVYFKYDWCDYDTHLYDFLESDSKIAKVKTNGKDYTVLKNASFDDSVVFYRQGNKVKFNTGIALNKLYVEDDNDGKAVYAYRPNSNKKEKILSPSEYLTLGNRIINLQYTDDVLDFITVQTEGPAETATSYLYCRKNLKTNKITVYQKVNL